MKPKALFSICFDYIFIKIIHFKIYLQRSAAFFCNSKIFEFKLSKLLQLLHAALLQDLNIESMSNKNMIKNNKPQKR